MTLFIFIFILDYEYEMADKKHQEDFLDRSQWSKKLRITLHHPSPHLSRTADKRKRAVQEVFCQGDESLEDEKLTAIRNRQQSVEKAIIEVDPLMTTQEVAEKLTSTVLWLFCI